VRFAKNHHFVAAGTGPADNRQLFFSGAPRSASEQEITQIFSAYGNVEEVTLFRERKTGSSKGSGLVMMATRQEAVRVMEMLGSRGEQQQQVGPAS
jgi:RNA recognition motif-containing protein